MYSTCALCLIGWCHHPTRHDSLSHFSSFFYIESFEMIRRNASKRSRWPSSYIDIERRTQCPSRLRLHEDGGERKNKKKSDRMICWDNEKFVIVALIHARNEEVWYYCFDWRSLVSGHD
ncbi:hypothetical protein OUZ56_031350 [Daphnia magna]|uniref:Uncharacterized protein n=1 Tax=Daphnia magna TaxID=35525 RepID=A0ABQ9ZTZ7_9CRUS|nr:hypothetical protein OUZ56_031350 [Daphnia magna]